MPPKGGSPLLPCAGAAASAAAGGVGLLLLVGFAEQAGKVEVGVGCVMIRRCALVLQWPALSGGGTVVADGGAGVSSLLPMSPWRFGFMGTTGWQAAGDTPVRVVVRLVAHVARAVAIAAVVVGGGRWSCRLGSSLTAFEPGEASGFCEVEVAHTCCVVDGEPVVSQCAQSVPDLALGSVNVLSC